MPKLGVNVDHVATVRQARGTSYPDPVAAAVAAQKAGADAITVHLREDRRHIQDQDLFRIKESISIRLNQELAATDEMIELALRLRPNEVCIVPERREELTTEGGLNALGLAAELGPKIQQLKQARIGVSLFIDAESNQIEAAADLGADFVELHTGFYANLADQDRVSQSGLGKVIIGEETTAEYDKIVNAAKHARTLKLRPNAGHGLNYTNAAPIARIAGIQWLHIGHSIVARAVMVGMARAVREMKALCQHR